MSRKANGVNYGKTAPQKSRRERVIKQLEAQLKGGVKSKKIEGINQTVDLTESDIKRINKELSTLKARV